MAASRHGCGGAAPADRRATRGRFKRPSRAFIYERLDAAVLWRNQCGRAAAGVAGLRNRGFTTEDTENTELKRNFLFFFAPSGRSPFRLPNIEISVSSVVSKILGLRSCIYRVGDRGDHAETAFARLVSQGATAFEEVKDVGGGIQLGPVRDPFGNLFGVIENPHFHLPA